ncbi:SatD family protein [Zhouia sp. PK063]|uniref:SatD family protein n=1 Tax=Zhouia sp. PK063 TaxID=3373602 RepID=UPI00379E432A
MISVITGDIINSRNVSPDDFLIPLRSVLQQYGTQPENWDIFRGDSFQLAIRTPETSFQTLLHLKAAIKSHNQLNVRLALGLGTVSYTSNAISEANGNAFINSGDAFERLKEEKTTILCTSDNKEQDTILNASLKLVDIITENWTQNTAELVKYIIEYPEKNQQEIGNLIGIKQNTVSERQKRSQIDALFSFDKYVFRAYIQMLKSQS